MNNQNLEKNPPYEISHEMVREADARATQMANNDILSGLSHLVDMLEMQILKERQDEIDQLKKELEQLRKGDDAFIRAKNEEIAKLREEIEQLRKSIP